MAKNMDYPTLVQIDQGFEIDCETCDDPDLSQVTATRIKLQLVEEPSTLSSRAGRDYLQRRLKDRRPQRLNLGWNRDPDEDGEQEEQERPPAELDIVVLARPPGREHWVRCGSWTDDVSAPWREIDAALITGYLARLVLALGLEKQMVCAS